MTLNRARASTGTMDIVSGTIDIVPCRASVVLFRARPMPAHRAWPIWPSIQETPSQWRSVVSMIDCLLHQHSIGLQNKIGDPHVYSCLQSLYTTNHLGPKSIRKKLHYSSPGTHHIARMSHEWHIPPSHECDRIKKRFWLVVGNKIIHGLLINCVSLAYSLWWSIS